MIEPSAVSLQLGDGTVLGADAHVLSDKLDRISAQFNAINYVKAVVHHDCGQLTLFFQGGFGLVFRAYDDAVAYRFLTQRSGELIVRNEEASFNSTDDDPGSSPTCGTTGTARSAPGGGWAAILTRK